MQWVIPDDLEPYLEELAAMTAYGDNVGDVATHLLREGIARELRRDGLLRRVHGRQMEYDAPTAAGEVVERRWGRGWLDLPEGQATHWKPLEAEDAP